MRAFGVGVSRRLTNASTPPNQENQGNSAISITTPTRRPLRSPLQSCDQNAMIARAPPKGSQPLSVKSGNANMPFEKQNVAGRHLTPSLSANAKQGNRVPLTPRVAGSTSPGAAPSVRRGARIERSDNNGTSTTSREDHSVPGSSYLSNNVTGRSGPRKTRVDSPANTPTGAPTPHSTVEVPRIAHDAPTYGGGLGINGIEREGRRQNVSFSPTVSDIGYQSATSRPDSKFFFASDVKSGAQQSRPTLQKQTFFYANGESIPPPIRSGGSTVGSSVGEEPTQPKFFHANGTPDLTPSPHFATSRSTVSNSSRITSPRLAATNPAPIFQRPESPQRLSQHASITSLKSAPGRKSPASNRPAPGTRGNCAQGNVASRRTSLEEKKRGGHSRSESLNSLVEAKTPPGRKVSYGSPEPQGALTPANLALSPVSISTEMLEEEDEAQDQVPSELLKSGHSIEHLNELASNARRERKVLDLEITNSSLEAINRTLEREMRKQTAELRRYRRLSRSGRLSINTSASIRTSSLNLSIMEGVEGAALSDMSEAEEGLSEEYFSSDEDSPDDGTLSPGAIAESDARHRKRDEKRLQLDLSKHQQLLTDSQRMNQSLKRCLGWTEELINEGKKALEYHVRVSDVKLGGRVLLPDEVGFNQELEDKNERMSGLHSPLLREVMKAAAWGGFGRDDRDSGIELDPDNGLLREPLQREPQ